MTKFEQLQETLTTLFRKLSFPVGGEISELEAIWMEESSSKKLLSMTTPHGFVTVTGNGDTIQHSKVEEIIPLYVSYFTGADSLQGLANVLS